MAIEAQDTGIEISSDGGTTWVDILGITSIEGPDGEASDIDVTTLKSTAKEYLTGLPDEGNISLSGFHLPADAGQDMARAAKVSRAMHDFKVTYSDSSSISFQGGVKSATRSAGVDGALETTFNIKINGAITEA